MTDILLGIETSGILCSVAWYSNNRILLEYNIEKANAHSSLLAGLVNDGMNKLDIHFSDLEAIAVACGPGSFTGLRIGMSYAKGLAFGLNLPLIAVSNLEILLAAAAIDIYPRMALLDARRGRMYSAIQMDKNSAMEKIRVISWKEVQTFPSGCLVLENNLSVPENVEFEPELTVIDGIRMQAGRLFPLAMQKLKKGPLPSLHEIEPLYVQHFAGVQ